VLYRGDNDWMIWIKLDRTQIDTCTMIFFEDRLKNTWELTALLRKTNFSDFCDAVLPRDFAANVAETDFWVDDLYHIQYWRVLVKRELVRLLSMRRVNRCQISELYVYSLMLGTAFLSANACVLIDLSIFIFLLFSLWKIKNFDKIHNKIQVFRF
jgi:hypothetical protein